MKKILVPALILILTVTVFTGCLNSQSGPNIPIAPNAPVASQEPTVDTSDPSTVVLVTVGGTENVYMSEFITLWDTYCYQYGIDETILNDPAYTEDLNALQKQLINSLIGEKILFLKLTELGYYDLTPTEIKEAEDAKEALITNYITTYEDEITADLDEDYSEAEYNMAVLQYRFELLESWNMTEEGLLEFQKGEIASNNAQEDLIPDPQPSNEQLVELYNNKVASDQESLAENPSMYEMYVLNYGYAPYYTPAGYRNIRQILIILSDETINQIKELRIAEDNDGADALASKTLLEIEDKAQEVLAKIQSEELTFEEALEQYNDDPGMATQPDGYPVSASSEAYLPNFTLGAAALSEIGEVSELIATDYGYHILQYTSDRPTGPSDFEARRDELYEEIIPSLVDQAWGELISTWYGDYEIESSDILNP